MLLTRWSAEAWAQVSVELRKAFALRSEIRRAEWFNCAVTQLTGPSFLARASASARLEP